MRSEVALSWDITHRRAQISSTSQGKREITCWLCNTDFSILYVRSLHTYLLFVYTDMLKKPRTYLEFWSLYLWGYVIGLIFILFLSDM
jgi:hypothetical protein